MLIYAFSTITENGPSYQNIIFSSPSQPSKNFDHFDRFDYFDLSVSCTFQRPTTSPIFETAVKGEWSKFSGGLQCSYSIHPVRLKPFFRDIRRPHLCLTTTYLCPICAKSKPQILTESPASPSTPTPTQKTNEN